MVLDAPYARDTLEHAAPPPVVEVDAEQWMTAWTRPSRPTSASAYSASLPLSETTSESTQNVAMLASTSGGNCSEMMVVTCPLRRPTFSCVAATAAVATATSLVAGHRLRSSSSPVSPHRLPPQHAGQPAQEKTERRGRDR
ncbi:uncharacterized protein LOC127784148 [Oryza glaberrima]|uniref:uncharacterized protein LOC127784148 n=1 Tax=Oryza glaberrima TaxID=4538 RepID=UPI00224C40FD|nr:uncharacterized protein LOC127784148 [Oryza glaberrima]